MTDESGASPLPGWDDAMQSLALALTRATTVADVKANASGPARLALGLDFPVRVLDQSEHASLRPRRRRAPDAGRLLLRDSETLRGAIVPADARDAAALDAVDPQRAQAVASLFVATLRRLQGEDAEQARLLKEAAELKFDVVSMLSHEMRTPLTSIKGYSSALLMEGSNWDDESRREFLEAIEAEADHLTKLVEDILEATAIEAGDLRLDLRPARIPKIAKRVVDKVAIQGQGHRFVLMFAPDFPDIEADAHRIEQVLTNLVDNAVKYSPDGGLVLVRGEADESEVTVSVVDEGIGIAPEHLNKLFERFFRARPNDRKRISGAGLGLPIAEAIVRAHGGRIWASSVVGSGTTLSFSLPRRAVAASQDANE